MMWKVFALTVLATATAFPASYIDTDILRNQIANYNYNNKYDAMHDSLEKECKKYGPTDAFSNLEQSLGNTAYRLAQTFASEVARDLGNKTISNYVDIACRTLKNADVKRQVEDTVTHFRQCTNPKYKKYVNSYYEIIEFACKNNGKPIINFVKDRGVECFKTHEPVIKQCVRKLYEAELSDVKDPEHLLADPKNVSRTLTIFKKCTAEELRRCSGNPAAEFIEGILDLKNFHFASKAK